MSVSPEPRQKWNSWDQLMQEEPQASLRLPPYGGMLYALGSVLWTREADTDTFLMKRTPEQLKGEGDVRFVNGKISERIQLRPTDSRIKIALERKRDWWLREA
jgi:hypothetical protein